MKKARIKESGVIVEGFLDGRGHFDVPVDHEIFDRYDVNDLEFEEEEPNLQQAAKTLVSAVERYVEPKPGDTYCSRNEVLMAKNNLKKLLNNEK